MTDKAKELLEDLKSQTNKILLDLVAENEELEGRLVCLIDRPCSVCKFHTERGCTKWTCVFEEKLKDPDKEGEQIMTRCKVCGKPLKLESSRRYEVMKLPVGLGCLTEHAHVFECFDCEHCGCQNIVNERETGYVKDSEEVDE